MGDAHRHKMPRGPIWNRLNMVGQVILALAAVLLVLRLLSWILPGQGWIGSVYGTVFYGRTNFPLNFLNYAWFVDLLFAGIFGVAFYFWFSGRVWCRFACPLAKGRLLRLDLLVRRPGGDHGRCPPAQDAPRAHLESVEHGGPGDPGVGSRAARAASA